MKYTTDIDAGLRDIATPGILREAALPAGIGRKQLFPGGIQASLSGFEADGQSSGRAHMRRNVTAGLPFGQIGPSDLNTLSVSGGMRNTDTMFDESNQKEGAHYAY